MQTTKRVHILATQKQIEAIDSVLLPGESRSDFIVQAALKRAEAREPNVEALKVAVNKIKEADNSWQS